MGSLNRHVQQSLFLSHSLDRRLKRQKASSKGLKGLWLGAHRAISPIQGQSLQQPLNIEQQASG